MRKKKTTDFERYTLALPEQDAQRVADFFRDVEQRCKRTKYDNRLLRHDFEQALLFYHSQNVLLETALHRLQAQHLGTFYAQTSQKWFPLDSAAKLYPLTMKHGQMSVFRLSFYLSDEVVPELLQMALNFTVKRFPSFATSVKKGFFWHYLEASNKRYSIEPETEIPCRPMKIARAGAQSFRVIYFHNRISAEFFHVLTDGTGGTIFLKSLVAEYLRLQGVDATLDSGVLSPNSDPLPDEFNSEFQRAQNEGIGSSLADQSAMQMKGCLSKRKPCQVLHFQMDLEELKQASKKNHATITAYILALMFVSCKNALRDVKGVISIQVPVNMRKFYPSNTLRNFSMYCGIRLPAHQITGVNEILNDISIQLNEKTSEEAMSNMMHATEKTVSLLRFIPLAIKTPLAKIVFGFLGDRAFTSTLSNLGVVHMPATMEERLDHMDFVLGTAHINRASCGMVTFQNKAVLSISKMTSDNSFESMLQAQLAADGISSLRVFGSELYEN